MLELASGRLPVMAIGDCSRKMWTHRSAALRLVRVRRPPIVDTKRLVRRLGWWSVGDDQVFNPTDPLDFYGDDVPIDEQPTAARDRGRHR
jgi:hypothetical protein